MDPLHGGDESSWSSDWIRSCLPGGESWWTSSMSLSPCVHPSDSSAGVWWRTRKLQRGDSQFAEIFSDLKNISVGDEVNIKLPSQAANAGVKYLLSGICNFFMHLSISCVLWHSDVGCPIYFLMHRISSKHLLRFWLIRAAQCLWNVIKVSLFKFK